MGGVPESSPVRLFLMNYWETGCIAVGLLWALWMEYRLRDTQSKLREAVLAKTDAEIQIDVGRLSDNDLRSELNKRLGPASTGKP